MHGFNEAAAFQLRNLNHLRERICVAIAASMRPQRFSCGILRLAIDDDPLTGFNEAAAFQLRNLEVRVPGQESTV